MNVGKLRGFLLQIPKPHVVRIEGDGEPQDLSPGRSYAKLADTIAALQPHTVTCLAADGRVLRATRLDTEEAHRSDAAAVPAILTTDPETARLTHFANLLHRAYEHSTEVAFQKLVDVVERIGDRSEAIEARLERQEAANRRMWTEQLQDAIDRAEEAQASGEQGGGSLLDQMAGAWLSGRAQATAVPRPPAKTNGAGKTNGVGNGKHPPKAD